MSEKKILNEEELRIPTGGAGHGRRDKECVRKNHRHDAPGNSGNTGDGAGPQIMTVPASGTIVPAPWAAPQQGIVKEIHDNDSFYFDPETGDKGDK